jgi:hypothetical protein
MKRAILVLSVLSSPFAFGQGFEVGVGAADEQAEQPQQGQYENEFDERAPVQEAAAAGSGAQQWQAVPPPPPTEEELEQSPMVNESAQPPQQAPTQQQFEQELSPYGQWVDTPQGRMWQPNASEVGEDFTPYSTGGTWAYNDYGWYFNTGWNWGWAPFHYGRWWRHPSYGWLWYPGYTWGSSWVDWRCAGGYVGWAPLGPPWASVQFGLGVPGWNFVGRNYLWHPYVSYHQINPRYAGGRYSWYHAPAYHGAPSFVGSSHGWRQPAWHAGAQWHGGGAYTGGGFGGGSYAGHSYAGGGFRSVPSTPSLTRRGSSAVRVGAGYHSSGHISGGHGGFGGGHHR